MLDEEEYKKKLREAAQIMRSSGFKTESNDYISNPITKENEDYATEYRNKLKEAENIMNRAGFQMLETDTFEPTKQLDVVSSKINDNKTNSITETNNKEEVGIGKKAWWVGKRTASGIVGGTAGLAQAGLTEQANWAKQGENESKKDILKKATNTPIQNWFSNQMQFNKKMIDTILDKDKSFIQKLVDIGLGAVSTVKDTITDSSMLTKFPKTMTKLMGNANQDTDKDILQINDLIRKPIDNWRQELAEEGQNYGRVTQTFGNVGEAVGNMIPSITASAITKNPTIGLSVMGLSAKGQSTQEALSKGAELEKAVEIGDTKGMIEIGTEMLTGGVNIFGKGALDEIGDAVVNRVTNKVGHFLARQGINATGEILEETISDVVGTVIDKGTVDPNASYSIKDWSETALETTLTTFVLNVITGGMVNDIRQSKYLDTEKMNLENQTKKLPKEIRDNISEDNIISTYKNIKDQDGTIIGVDHILGLEIENPNKMLDIKPIIIKDNETNLYNVIDKETGEMLYNTNYDNLTDTIIGFNTRIANLSESETARINDMMKKTQLQIIQQINNGINEQQNTGIDNKEPIQTTQIDQQDNLNKETTNISTQNENVNTSQNSNEVIKKNSQVARTFEKEIESYKNNSKVQNKINGNIVEINTNIFENVSKKKQGQILNEYLKHEVYGHDYYVDGQKIIADKYTIGKLKNGKTNYGKGIDNSIKTELKANIITNLENIIKNSVTYQSNLKDTKNHTFANTFERRKSIMKYKEQNYEIMFEIGKKEGKNTLYSIEKIKKTQKNRLSRSTQTNKSLQNTDKTVGEPRKSNTRITQKNENVKKKSTKKDTTNKGLTKKTTNKEENTVKTNEKVDNKQQHIEDFGEKIGGARKDVSNKGLTRKTTKEVIHDYTVKLVENGYNVEFKGKPIKEGFKTPQEAEKYILEFKENIKNNLVYVEDLGKYQGLYLSKERYVLKMRNPRSLKSSFLDKSFNDKQEAENYAMALSMYLKENGKNLFRPSIQKIERINPNIKNATKTTGENILDNFGFKGGEFGNWVKQDERQQFLNYAQDAFTDLATALDVEPKSLGQQGQMNIAFGARGKGLTSAVAHFEPSKQVINMTRLKGAGSLAHEYGHSIDNYLSRMGGYSESGMATSNSRNPKLSNNMQKAIKDVTEAINYNISTNQDEINKKNAIYEKNRIRSLEDSLKYMDKVFNGEATKYKRVKGEYKNVPIEVTDKQKQEYKKIREILIKGQVTGERQFNITNPRALKTETVYPEPVNKLQALYKEVVGRKLDDDTVYSIFRRGKPANQVTEVKTESAYSKSALELDRVTGRVSAYFSTIEEKWARAFESYIYDKLKAKGITNTYLVHSVNNEQYALFNPFPAGEERININRAFDNLIKTMKEEGLFTEQSTKSTLTKMEDRTFDNVSDKNIKLYQQEFPEVQKEIQEMAYNFQEDLENSISGERYKIGDKWTGIKGKTTDELSYIKDNTSASWEQIDNALNDIANNKGNYALAKKVELVLDKALMNGYKNIYGKKIEPNNSYIEKKSKIEGINYKEVENAKNDEIRELLKENIDIYSMKKGNKQETDNQGRILSKEQRDFFKESKVRDEKGNLKVVYHGTPYKFNVFNYDKLGENTSSLGAGFYFTDKKTTGEEYTRQDGELKTVYLDIEKPMNLGKTTISKEEYKRFIEAINIETKGRYLEDYNGIDEALMEYEYGGDDIDLVSAVHEASGLSWKKIYEILKNTIGYDGIISEKGFLNKEETLYVVFNSNQIKSINNATPTDNEDIRYMKKKNTIIDPKIQKELHNRTENVKNDIYKEKDKNGKSVRTNAERADAWIEQEIQKIEATENWDNSIPITKRTDIRKTIEDYLGLNIKRGHFRQQAYGIYRKSTDTIRTKEYKDMDSILHEVGHALDLGGRINVNKETISIELLKAVNQLGGYDNETRTVQLDEGFAEIIREYSIIPEQAKKDYPKTVSVLEEIRQANTSFDNFIGKVQKQTYNYIHQNPENRSLSNMSIGERTDKTKLTKNLVKQKTMEAIYDKDYAIKMVVEETAKLGGKTTSQIKASENAYYLTRLASGIGDKIVSMLSDGYIDEKGKKLMPGLNKMGEILGNNPQRYNDLRAYLVSQRDLEYKAKSLKTGIRTMDSMTVVEQFKNDKQIQKAAQLVYDTLDGVLQYAVDNGLVDNETAKALRESNTFYVPMQRVIENQGNNVGRKGAVADVIKHSTGSELDVKDILENVITNSANIIQQVENNKVLKALYKESKSCGLAEGIIFNEGKDDGLGGIKFEKIDTPMKKVGTANLAMWEKELNKQGVDTKKLNLEKTVDIFAPNTKIDTRQLITSFINDNGKRVYLQFNDQTIFNSLMNLDSKNMSIILKFNRFANLPLRYGATMANIGFAIPNMISDTAQATIYSTAGFIPVVDNVLGVIDILASTNETAKQFLNQVAPDYAKKINGMYELYKQTGATSATRMSQYRSTTQNLMKDIYGTKNSQTLGINERFKPLKRLLDILTYIPELSEQSTRFRVFEKNYDYYKQKGSSEMDSRIMAALESRDATQDFGRTGYVTQEINQLVPFSAARVGSIYTFAEKIKANPKQVTMKIAILTAMALAIKGLGNDDDEIQELNQRKKDDNFVLRAGDTIVTIKKPQGILRSIINLAEYVQDLFTGNIEEGKEGERLKEWLNNAIMDNMPADSITGLVPNGVAPLIENAINKDFYYNTDIVKSYDLDLPNAQQYYEYNSQLAILLGKIFNYSPAKIDNLISGYFGGLGTSVTNIIDYMSGKLGLSAEKPDMGTEQNSIGKRFVVNVDSNSQSLDEIYKEKTELTKKKNGGTITSEETEKLENITKAISGITKLNKQIREIKKDLTLSGKEKAEQIKELQQQRTDLARQGLDKEVINQSNIKKNASLEFYPTQETLKDKGYSLQLTDNMKEEYKKEAYNFYKKYEKQGLYSKDKLTQIKSNAKDYAKSKIMQKYRNKLTRTK